MTCARGLEARPPDVVVRLRRCVEDELTARIERPVGPDIDVSHVPHGHFRDNDTRLVADPDAEANAV